MHKKNNYIILLLIVLLFLLSNFKLQTKEILNKKIKNLINILQTYHYKKLSLNEQSFSEIKKIFINNLDPFALYFTEEDIKKLLNIKLNNSDFEKEESFTFFDETVKCYNQRLNEANEFISTLLKKPFDYSKNDIITLYINNYNNNFERNKNDLIIKWKKWLKYKILLHFFYKVKEKNILINDQKSIIPYEKKIYSLVEKREKMIIKGILNHPDGFEKYISSQFLNAVASRYDPHTIYFSYNDKKKFEESISSEAYSFGIYLKKNNNGDIQIDKLVPGGPAWKSYKLNKNDFIVKIQFPGNKESSFEIADLTLYETNELINNSKSDRIILTIRKKNGLTEEITLIKEKLQIEKNTINSFILNGTKKIGYIYLPAFYGELERADAPGCANDVAKEILKLTKDGIQGIILDLRNNSGGAIIEAINLAGIFIDEGPICIQKNNDSKLTLLKDLNRGTIYNGPLVLMVNQHSASASEFLAAALKDYNRAVIIGNKTFGKATAQIILPIIKDLNELNKESNKKYNNNDFVKMTVNQYFNLSGNSHQLVGVTPDIYLPEIFSFFNFNEKSLPFGLEPDKASKSVKYNKGPEISKSKLAELSIKRISKDDNFNKIKSLNNKLHKYSDEKIEIQLSFQTFMNDMNIYTKLLDSLEKTSKRVSSLYEIANNTYDLEIIKIDSYKKELNDILLKQIHEDIYIEEAYQIINDYIKILKNKGDF